MKATDELWASGDWVETDFDRHRWIKANRAEMNENPTDGKTRWFAPRGHQWPLICLSVWRQYPRRPPGVLISVSMKESADGWFSDCTLPPSLVPQLVQMIAPLCPRATSPTGRERDPG